MLDYIVELTAAKGVKDRVVVVHAALGRVEWPDTKELVKEHAAHYGLPFFVESRKQNDLLEHVRQRGMWPSNTERYCTSDHKRGPIGKLFTKWTQEKRGGRKRSGPVVRFLNLFGFRAEESTRRRKLDNFSVNKRLTNSCREVHDWLPIQNWTLDQVWARIKQAGTRHHWAYDRGMKRLSCRLCIFAPRSQLMLSAMQPENKELFAEYLAVEREIDHTFRQDQSLAEIDEAIRRGEKPGDDDGVWNM